MASQRYTNRVSSPLGAGPELRLSTSNIPKANTYRNGGLPDSTLISPDSSTLKNPYGDGHANMSYTSTTTVVPAAVRKPTSRARLHKRGDSGSSPAPQPSPTFATRPQHGTTFAAYEEPNTSNAVTTSMTPAARIKPYLRKTPAAKDDQGRLDLSRSTTENERLAGLGIQELGTRSASDITFAPAGRRGTHGRNTSGGSQLSTGSGTYRPSQPFVHPMRQSPRPYTPPTGSSSASFVNHDEADEIEDVVDDDFRLGHGFRSRRSMSISSTPQVGYTPLSQSHTAEELGIVPKLTSRSQSNLSVHSARSGKSKLGKSRMDTEHSLDLPTSPSSRTSIDKAFSFVSRRSEETTTRDERIRAARQKFEEKEANKDRRLEREALKRRETDEAKSSNEQARQIRKSEASERARVTKPNRKGVLKASPKKTPRPDEFDEKLASRSYDQYRPSHDASLPRQGQEAGMSEKTTHAQDRKACKTATPQSGWIRFSAWFQTRMLDCGGER